MLSVVVRFVKAVAPLTLTSSLLSVITALLYVYVYTGSLDIAKAASLLIGVSLLHAAINLYNDYRDYKSGIDIRYRQLNVPHRLNAIIDLGFTPGQVKLASLLLALFATCIGMVLIILSRAVVALALAIFGALVGYLYSIYLRRVGVGEFLAGLAVGPGVVLGCLDVLTNLRVDLVIPLLIGLVNGVYTTIILAIIGIARLNVDKQLGKYTLAVRIGAYACRIVVYALLILAYVISVLLVTLGLSPIALLALVLLPFSLVLVQRLAAKKLFYIRIAHIVILLTALLL